MPVAYHTLLRRERLVAEQVPYTVHVSERVLRTGLDDYLQVFRLGGVSFESVDDAQLNNWHERLNILWRNIASSDVALWVHVIRRRELAPIAAGANLNFADALNAKYQQWLGGETLMVNELYLSVLVRGSGGAVGGLLSRLMAAGRTGGLETRDTLEVCEKMARIITASLARYEPEPLGTYRRGIRWYSSLLEFLGLLLNGEREEVALSPGSAAEYLPRARLLFGAEAMEYRLPTVTRVGAFLGIREYASPSLVGFYNRLLSAPFSFVLTQSFLFLSKATGQGLLQRQIHRMANAGDFGVSQAAQLTRALDALTGNEFVMGEHHFSLQVLAEVDGVRPALTDPSERLRSLNEHVARARALLADTGMAVAREDLALEAAFWRSSRQYAAAAAQGAGNVAEFRGHGGLSQFSGGQTQG